MFLHPVAYRLQVHRYITLYRISSELSLNDTSVSIAEANQKLHIIQLAKVSPCITRLLERLAVLTSMEASRKYEISTD